MGKQKGEVKQAQEAEIRDPETRSQAAYHNNGMFFFDEGRVS